jgi:hypothetical protein
MVYFGRCPQGDGAVDFADLTHTPMPLAFIAAASSIKAFDYQLLRAVLKRLRWQCQALRTQRCCSIFFIGVASEAGLRKLMFRRMLLAHGYLGRFRCQFTIMVLKRTLRIFNR